MTRAEEIAAKLARVRALLAKEGLDGLLLTQRNNIAWLSGGIDVHVPMGAESGVAYALVTADDVQILTDTIEAPRLEAEELADTGFKLHVTPWYAGAKDKAAEDFAKQMKLGADSYVAGTKLLGGAVAQLRYSLLPTEVERYRALGKDCARIISETMQEIRPGMSEFAVAGNAAKRLLEAEIEPYVILVASDERIKRVRHPIAVHKNVDKHCMVVICGLRHGLILSVTRIVHFGPLSADLQKRHQAVVQVDGDIIAATKPGATAGQMFKVLTESYAKVGFPDEWQHHHQGGAAGYAARDWRAERADDPTVIVENQGFAWNPSIAGTKSEDTIITSKDGVEILSATPAIPTITINTQIGPIARSQVLVL
jgi:Xaa-Pro dipeptidase